MQQKSRKIIIIPLISLSIFMILIFGAAYAYYVANTSMNVSNYQITLPKVTTLTCSKTDCNVTITPAQMSTATTDSNNAAVTSSCSLNCTCSGTEGAVCDYNIRLIELDYDYSPSTGLGSNKEFTARVTSPSNCTSQNSSSIETQVNTLKDKVVSNCTLTIPQSGSVSANVGVEFKWYNLNLDQSSHASKIYKYQLTNDNNGYIVTFDANGGTVSTTSKTVIYGKEYGELPTPTWEGHTFRGWNGKNKFNKSASLVPAIKNDTVATVWASSTLNNNWVIKNLKPNTTYNVSFESLGVSVPDYDSKAESGLGFVIYSGVSGYQTMVLRESYYIKVGEVRRSSINFTTVSNLLDTSANYRLLSYTNRYTKNGSSVIGSVLFSRIQIEEGNTTTVYEPYYVTETTKVTQAKDHILTAIWD